MLACSRNENFRSKPKPVDLTRVLGNLTELLRMNEGSQDDITSIFVHEIVLIPSAYILVVINKDYWNFVSNPSHDDRQIDVTIPHNVELHNLRNYTNYHLNC